MSLPRLPAQRGSADGRLDDDRGDALRVTKGTPKVYKSSENVRRHFCPECGTGLFYVNEKMLPGIIDIQSATNDDPDAVPAQVQIQVAERIGWMERAHELPAYERFPPPS